MHQSHVGAEAMAAVSLELEELGRSGTSEGAATLAAKLDEPLSGGQGRARSGRWSRGSCGIGRAKPSKEPTAVSSEPVSHVDKRIKDEYWMGPYYIPLQTP